jgi:hypothetical protein
MVMTVFAVVCTLLILVYDFFAYRLIKKYEGMFVMTKKQAIISLILDNILYAMIVVVALI